MGKRVLVQGFTGPSVIMGAPGLSRAGGRRTAGLGVEEGSGGGVHRRMIKPVWEETRGFAIAACSFETNPHFHLEVILSATEKP
jgi:hypothetical protein